MLWRRGTLYPRARARQGDVLKGLLGAWLVGNVVEASDFLSTVYE